MVCETKKIILKKNYFVFKKEICERQAVFFSSKSNQKKLLPNSMRTLLRSLIVFKIKTSKQ